MSEQYFNDDPVEAIMVRSVPTPDSPPFLVDDLIHDAATILYGRPEAGKSYYALSAATAITEGSPWLGRNTRRGKVLMMGLDPGQNRESKRRIDKIPGETDFLVSQRRPEPEDWWWEKFTAWAVEQDVNLVIVDNLKRLVPRGSVNKDEDVGPALARLDMLIDAGIAVLLIHHQGKPGEEGLPTTPMGASCIEGWARQFIRVQRVPGTRVSDLHIFGNDVEEYDLRTLHVPDGNGEHGAFFTVVAETDTTVTTTYERGRQRYDQATVVARYVLDAPETFTGLHGVAKWLTTNTPDGVNSRGFEAWKKWLKRAVFQAGLLTGGSGQPVVAGPALDVALAA